MTKISITELQTKIGDWTTLIIKGEEILITRNGKDFAKIIPIAPDKTRLDYNKKEI